MTAIEPVGVPPELNEDVVGHCFGALPKHSAGHPVDERDETIVKLGEGSPVPRGDAPSLPIGGRGWTETVDAGNCPDPTRRVTC